MDSTDVQQPLTSADMQKLEEDLKKLEQESLSQPTTPNPTSAEPVKAEPVNPPVNFPTLDKPIKKGFPLIQIAILLAVSAILATLCYILVVRILNKANILSITPKGCTAEAMLCPDGSAVGRTAPNCEFAACPEVGATPDPTADWETYLNTSANYSIKYPQDWGIENVSAGSNGALSPDARYIQVFYKVSTRDTAYGNLGIEETGIIPPSEEKLLTIEKKLNTGLTLKCNGNFMDDAKTWCWIKIPNKEAYLNIQVFKGQDVYANNIYDQILSTFKFAEAIPSNFPGGS